MLSGARIVRIATHLDLPSQGYGSRALQQLHAYYEGKLVDLLETEPDGRTRPRGGPRGRRRRRPSRTAVCSGRPSSRARRRASAAALAARREAAREVPLDAAAFGLTQRLHKFWTRAGYQPVYLHANPRRRHRRQRGADSSAGLQTRRRTRRTRRRRDTRRQPRVAARLLRGLQAAVHVAARRAVQGYPPGPGSGSFGAPGGPRRGARARMRTGAAVRRADGDALTAHDLRRLEKYAQSLVDHHLVADLVPPLARAYFGESPRRRCRMRKPPSCSRWACSTRRWTTPRGKLGLPTPQVMALFNKAVRKMRGAARGEDARSRGGYAERKRAPEPQPARRRARRGPRGRVRLYASRVFRLAYRVFGFFRHSRSLRSRLADAPGTTKNAPRRK